MSTIGATPRAKFYNYEMAVTRERPTRTPTGRQAELWERPVTYAAVGASQAPDLLVYPPAGYRPFDRRARIGHGDARFEWAWSSAMSWGIQKNSGFRVEIIETPSELREYSYTPVEFDDEGNAMTPALTSAPDEAMFGPDGAAFVAPGDTVVLHIPFLFFTVKAPARVVYVVDEPDRKGFAYGTLRGHPESGEELFAVERRGDGSVWLNIRAFSRPASPVWWLAAPVMRIAQELTLRRYDRALAGPMNAKPRER